MKKGVMNPLRDGRALARDESSEPGSEETSVLHREPPANDGRALPVYFHTDDPHSAFVHFLTLAQAIPSEGLEPFRQDPDLARNNIELGLSAVTPHLARVPAVCPNISVAGLLELPALGRALVYAHARVPAPAASARAIQKALREVTPLREWGVTYLELAANLRLIPAAVTRKLRGEKGPLAIARSAVLAAGIFREYADELRGKHPFTQEQLDTLMTKGAWLLGAVKPTGARRRPTQRTPASIVRDQFARLLDERYEGLRQVGAMLFGVRGLDAKVPPLYSGTRAATAEEEGDEGVDEGTTDADDASDADDTRDE
jgi:hypothetical protein